MDTLLAGGTIVVVFKLVVLALQVVVVAGAIAAMVAASRTKRLLTEVGRLERRINELSQAVASERSSQSAAPSKQKKSCPECSVDVPMATSTCDSCGYRWDLEDSEADAPEIAAAKSRLRAANARTTND